VTGFAFLLMAAALLLAAIVTLRRRRETVAMPPQARRTADGNDDGIDWDELERAEREIRDLDHDGAGGAPDQAPGDDWGPGASKPPLA